MGRHVEVIKEAQQVLPTCWYKHAFGSLLYATLHDSLDVIRGGLDSHKYMEGGTETQKNKD